MGILNYIDGNIKLHNPVLLDPTHKYIAFFIISHLMLFMRFYECSAIQTLT